MNNNKEDIKEKNLKQIGIIVSLIILLTLIGYAIFPDREELSNNISTENTQTNIVNNIHTNVSINDIPEYSGQIVIDINNNVPYFEDTDITTENFEYYSPLDEFERSGVAFANICKYTMPPEEAKRGSLSYKPTGWVQYLYGENNRYHLYERCHLIAWQLGNENNNRQNLITGTVQLNDTMVEYENIIANWIKQKNKQDKDYHVLYRVTPIYDGENMLATGVEIEAKSVEEDGVSFNKFIYNVQDNFEIDYRTGEAKLLEYIRRSNLNLYLDTIIEKLEQNDFIKNFMKELSEALENFNKKNQLKGEKMDYIELTKEEDMEFYRKKWDFLENYFNKELSDLSKGEIFIVTNKYENDYEYHRYKITQYKNHKECKYIAFEKDLPENVKLGDVVRKIDGKYIYDEQATKYVTDSINKIKEDIINKR